MSVGRTDIGRQRCLDTTAEDRHGRWNRGGGSDRDQHQSDGSSPRLWDSVRQQQPKSERKRRSCANDKTEQWGTQNDIHVASVIVLLEKTAVIEVELETMSLS
jgi:hypothetical protein